MATRVFNYTPGYPISYGAGSTEKQNSAWSKVVLEIERIYRLISEGFNYFAREIERIDSIIGGSGGSGSGIELLCPVGSIIAYSGLKSQIPSNWHLCDGTGGTPDLRDRFLMGTANAGDLDTYKSAGVPNITGNFMAYNNGEITSSGFNGIGLGESNGAFAYNGGDIWAYRYNKDDPNEYNGSYSDIEDDMKTKGNGWVNAEMPTSLDASRSSSVYGNSDTVQPPSYVVYYIMRMS